MEVLRYLKANVVVVKWFDLDSKEIRTHQLKENQLNKAA